LTTGEKVIRFIESFCRVPEGDLRGKPMVLMPFQRKFVIDVYDNTHRTSRAYLSLGRKNGKTALIAAIVLAHIDGPVAIQNSQVISGARSRKQAAIVFKLAEKMVRMSPVLSKRIKPTPSEKKLLGLAMNAEYEAISAEAGTAHGLSPVVAILDEVGQVKGPYDAFVEAIETAQGAYEEDALLIAISTQAPTDNDLFSRWIDDAANSNDPHIVSHVYSAPDECDLLDREAWRAANPAMGIFRSLSDIEQKAERAMRLPSEENTFRWLFLNQRVEASSPIVSRSVWELCGAPPKPLDGVPVYAGLDLSAVNDLTALVLIGQVDGVWQVHPTFWMPRDVVSERSRADRVPYDVWYREGHLLAAPGKSVDYSFVADYLRGLCDRLDIRKIAFDRWGFSHLKPWLVHAGFSEAEIEARFEEFGQGYASISPALRELEGDWLNTRLAHGNHPVLRMCISNAVVETDPAGNKKLNKKKSTGRIDGAQALVMARGVVPSQSIDLDVSAMVA
jgi:phage terminase large subunit-like protein